MVESFINDPMLQIFHASYTHALCTLMVQKRSPHTWGRYTAILIFSNVFSFFFYHICTKVPIFFIIFFIIIFAHFLRKNRSNIRVKINIKGAYNLNKRHSFSCFVLWNPVWFGLFVRYFTCTTHLFYAVCQIERCKNYLFFSKKI